MVRNTVKFCLLTFFIFAHCSIFHTQVNARTDVRLDLEELTHAPEANCQGLALGEHQRIFEIDCNFQNRFMFSQLAEKQDKTSITHSPANFEPDAPPLPRPAKNLVSQSQRDGGSAFWPAATQRIRILRANLISGSAVTENNILKVIKWVRTEASQPVSTLSGKELLTPKNPRGSLTAMPKRLSIPIFLVSNRTITKINLEPMSRQHIPMFLVREQNVADSFDSEQMLKVQEIDGPESSISIEIEKLESDSYWQYYDDCDRWGVDFAMLLEQALSGQPFTTNFIDESESQVVRASFNQLSTNLQNRDSYLFQIRKLAELYPSILFSSIPPILDFNNESLTELIALGEFGFFEQLTIEPNLVFLRPPGPLTQALSTYQRLNPISIQRLVSNVQEQMNLRSLSRHIDEAQVAYSKQLDIFMVEAEKLNVKQKNRLRHQVADRITIVAEWLNAYAKVIRPPTAPLIASHAESLETK